MKTAKRIYEFTPDQVISIENVTWLSVQLMAGRDYIEYKALPKIAEYKGIRFYKMSFNSDSHLAHYKEAGKNLYHTRFIG